MTNAITIAGNIIIDYVKEIDSFPNQGMLTNIRKVTKSAGGCTVNVGVSLKRMDSELDIRVVGMVGNDPDGKYITSLLLEENIDVSMVKESKNQTSYTDVMNNMSNGERTFFQYRGANADFGYEDIPYDKLSKGIFHIGYALLLDKFDAPCDEYAVVMAKTLAKVQSLGIKTSMDVVSEDSDRFNKLVMPSLKYCNYLIVNEVEGGRITEIEPRDDKGLLNIPNLKRICISLKEIGVEDTVVIHAPEGSCAYTKDNKFYFEPSYILPDGYVKGTVGAGDAFCAAILYGFHKNIEITQALKLGAGAAACNLSEANSIDGMRNIKKTRELMDSLKQREV